MFWCILTIDKLMKRGKTLVYICFLYKRETEFYNNFLLWYPLVYKLWTMTYELLEISWVMARSVRRDLHLEGILVGRRNM